MSAPRAFTLRSPAGLSLRVTDAGAAWMSCVVPLDGEAGPGREVLLGYATPADYLVQPGYLGAIVGRYANRIAGASFALDGRTFALDANEGPNQLHGGARGFHRHLWTLIRHDDDVLELGLRSPDGDQGFPGQVDVRVTYRIEAPLTVSVSLEARTDAPTLVNLSSHAYFSLDGPERGILDQQLRINAPRYLPVRADLIPTGEQAAVDGTPFDFRRPRRIGEALEALRRLDTQPACHDHCWLLDAPEAPAAAAGGVSPVAAVLRSGDGRLGLALHSSAPGLQFYAGEFLPQTPGRDGRPHARHAGLALEPQALPDSPHHPEWPQPGAVLRPGEVYRHRLTYRFLPTSASEEAPSPPSSMSPSTPAAPSTPSPPTAGQA
ncbi:galactose mutarotase [Mitsuaria sp. GD03876]|uniref:aldose epimerase family protein n=1 Tax=Mitsuaria sp. GD03876 TaxID=2975399 RepID=UPI00244D3FFE|nr:galactose mutarotase [Mitsuaria sp. GD03876]MDH0867399.1 galactose mutarotase [Mitsuaria sp. GD03876]